MSRYIFTGSLFAAMTVVFAACDEPAAPRTSNPATRSLTADATPIKKPVQDTQWAGAEYDLLTAIQRDDRELVKAILEETPDLADDFQGQSPLRAAASLGRLEICRFLLDECDVDVNDFGRGMGFPILLNALAFPDVVRLLIEHGADLRTRITWRGGRTGVWVIGDEATALHYAASDGVPETIKLLIDNGVDVFATAHGVFDPNVQQTSLEVAACFGKAENAAAIVGHPQFDAAQPQLRQSVLDRCLCFGVMSGCLGSDAERPNLVKLLLQKGANSNATENGVTAMQIAARQIHPDREQENSKIKEMIALLMEHGASLDFFSAVAIGDEGQVRRLLTQNPTLSSCRSPDGYPALHFAVGMNYERIVQAILDAGGDVDIRNKCDSTGHIGESALHCAAFWGRDAIARRLIKAGADVNALTDRKSTPLHDAARMTNVEVVCLLLKNGADPNGRDKDHKTPLDWCRELNRTNAAETEKVLREHGAENHKR